MGLTDVLTKMEKHHSLLEDAIRKIEIPTCSVFGTHDNPKPILFDETGEVLSTKDTEKVKSVFPNTMSLSGNKVLKGHCCNPSPLKGKRVAVLFSGGPAAGGHNVIYGIKKILGKENVLLGVKNGPKGLIEGKLFEITDEAVAEIINTGGFDFLGTDRTKIKTDDQIAKVKKTCIDNNLDAIVIIGGDDSNTNASILAEILYKGVKPDGGGIQVIGLPKTIDGDLAVGDILPISFGFDTATKIYSEMVGNILEDTTSSRKYWHFIKLMGRAASHVALEVALQCKPAFPIVSEEVSAKKMSLSAIVDMIAKTVIERSKKGMNFGVVLVPEGLIEFIPEITALLKELNDKVAKHEHEMTYMHDTDKKKFIVEHLIAENARLLESLPFYIVNMLLADRDSHGNLQVSLIPTEMLLIDMVKVRVHELDPKVPFATNHHFFGYEGRCGAPTLFDAAYSYNLGLTAGSLILAGKTGYMASVTDLDKGGKPLAIPLTGLLDIERRSGVDEFVIQKALVQLESPAFKYLELRRSDWAKEDCFSSPGPRQYMGPSAKQLPITVALNRGYSSLNFDIS